MKKANKLLIRIWNNNKIVLTYQVTVYRRFHSIFYSDIIYMYIYKTLK